MMWNCKEVSENAVLQSYPDCTPTTSTNQHCVVRVDDATLIDHGWLRHLPNPHTPTL